MAPAVVGGPSAMYARVVLRSRVAVNRVLRSHSRYALEILMKRIMRLIDFILLGVAAPLAMVFGAMIAFIGFRWDLFSMCAATGLCALSIIARSGRRKRAFGECNRCGYPILGIKDGRCPECGEPIRAGWSSHRHR